MRTIWKGSISFGPVYIPIAVYPATRKKSLVSAARATDQSDQIQEGRGSGPERGAADQIVKGFEYERRHIVLKDEDFQGRIESTHSIDITDSSISPVDPKFSTSRTEPQRAARKPTRFCTRRFRHRQDRGCEGGDHNREYLASVKPDGLFLSSTSCISPLRFWRRRTQEQRLRRSPTR
jgi:DNA end-binding protein Ku